MIANMLCGICGFDLPYLDVFTYPDIYRGEVLDPGIDYQGSAIGDSRATQEAGSSGGASGSSRRLEFNMFAGAPGLDLPVEVSQPSDSIEVEEVEAQSSLAVGSRDPEPANENTVDALWDEYKARTAEITRLA